MHRNVYRRDCTRPYWTCVIWFVFMIRKLQYYFQDYRKVLQEKLLNILSKMIIKTLQSLYQKKKKRISTCCLTRKTKHKNNFKYFNLKPFFLGCSWGYISPFNKVDNLLKKTLVDSNDMNYFSQVDIKNLGIPSLLKGCLSLYICTYHLHLFQCVIW